MAARPANEFQVADIPPHEEIPAEEHTTGTEHAGDAHGAKPGLPQLDVTTFASQLFWLVISFAVLYAVISRVAVPKISGVLADRAARIKADLDQAAQAKQSSDAAIANYEKALADARLNASKIGDDLRKTVQAEADTKNAAAAKQLAADTAKAEVRIGEMRTSAMAKVGDVAREAAAEIIAKLTGETANAGDLDAAVRNALKRS